MRFHILDTETVGLKPFDHGGGVCEISVREVDENFNLIAHHYSYLYPEGPINPAASGVHGILDRHVEDKPTMRQWLDADIDFWAEDQEPIWFIAYNAGFDWKFLAPYIKCKVAIADVLVLARRYYPDSPDHKMQTLRVVLDLPFDVADSHSAGGDTQTLLNLMKRMCQDTNLSLGELCLDAQRKEPIVKFPFGKHKNKLIADVAKSDPGYLKWCLAKMETLQPDMREALELALQG